MLNSSYVLKVLSIAIITTVSSLILINIFTYSCVAIGDLKRTCKKPIKIKINIIKEKSSLKNLNSPLKVKYRNKHKTSIKMKNNTVISMQTAKEIPKKQIVPYSSQLKSINGLKSTFIKKKQF